MGYMYFGEKNQICTPLPSPSFKVFTESPCSAKYYLGGGGKALFSPPEVGKTSQRSFTAVSQLILSLTVDLGLVSSLNLNTDVKCRALKE